MLPPLRPIPIKDREPMVFLEYGHLDVADGAFVLVDGQGVRVQIPVGGLACLMLQPGTRVSHAAAVLAARCGTLLIWVGEAGVRLYASGQPGGARSDRLLYQARLALDEDARLRVVRRMFALRFEDDPPARRSVDQLRGIEGARVKALYKGLAQQYGVTWQGRRYDPASWTRGDLPNRCVSAANACLYGVTEAAVLAAGYAPAIGFLHTGKPLSFVYDIADIVKFETSVPVAFQVAREAPPDPEAAVRRALRDTFRKTRLLGRLIPLIEEILAAGGLAPPEAPQDAVPPAFPDPGPSGDAGHRG
ncbi:type I-E CRISPR-associated endonuclease Cas1e [Caenispirillum bisanense]|uniref:CRISPR-associated endonuclease Cas1 n=1 Tax=Caenispirillum bisanense TaxID=414052 RepID=A0A286GV73_9PROT|nr:type I-E CRISPR-associated endonuclease Cas1e [Caenispirillum bisanense]SOD99435.1 CRISPR-associated protein, Cas1 family [Caenispirillum bisanense]